MRWAMSVAEQVRALLGTASADPPSGDRRQPAARGPQWPTSSGTLASYAAYYEQWAEPWKSRRCCGRTRSPVTSDPRGERFRRWSTRRVIPPVGCPRRRVLEIRRMKALVDFVAATARRRSDDPHQAGPRRPGRSSGRCSCFSCDTPARSRPCTTPPRWSAWTPSPPPSDPRQDAELLRQALADGDSGPQRAGVGSGKPTISCPDPAANSTPSRSPRAGRTATVASFWTTTSG